MGAKAPQIEQGHKGPGGTLMSSCSEEMLLEPLIYKGEWYQLESISLFPLSADLGRLS